MDVSIIIVSYNTKDLLLECLKGLSASTDTLKKEIIVVDNASTDDSIEAIKTHYPQVKIITNNHNPGFGVANNVGAATAKGEYLFFLNSDTKVSPESLQTLVDKAKGQKAQLSTGTLVNTDGSLQPQGGALPTLSNIAAWMLFVDDLPLLSPLINAYQQRRKEYFQKDQIMGWVGGTALLISRGLFEELKGFNPDIFMYGEDVDICLRAQKLKGVQPHYFSIPAITHVGQGSGTNENSLIGEYVGMVYLFRTYYPAWQLLWVKLLLKIGALCRLVIFGIILRSESKKRAYQQALGVV